MRVGDGLVPAFYSGSPELARTINLVRLTAGEVIVTREPLIWRDVERPGERPGGGDGGPSLFGIL
jgi:hypothetical protein